jgi:hypothetical protein
MVGFLSIFDIVSQTEVCGMTIGTAQRSRFIVRHVQD